MHRGWQDNPVFKPEPYSEREAWEWIIAHAAWEAKEARISGEVVSLERGEIACSLRYLAEAWRWSKSHVQRFLKRIATAEMVRDSSGTASGTVIGQKVTHLTVCNYSRYQDSWDSAWEKVGHPRDEKRDKRERTKQKKDSPPSSKRPYSAEFETFWRTYPRRRTDSKRNTSKAFDRAQLEVPAETIISAADNYRDDLAQTGKLEFAKGAAAWLNGATWENYIEKVVHHRDPIGGQPQEFSECPL
jgi:hypothetical protein